MRKQGMLFAWGILIFFILVDSALAAGANAWKATDTFRVMNFIVLVGILVFLLRNPLTKYLNNRIEGIKEDFDTLALKKKEAEEALAQYKLQLAEMDKEAARIQEEYKKQGEAARELIIKEAEATATKMKEQARHTIEEEFFRARQKLQAEIMEIALEKAESLIMEKIQPEDHERLTAEYLKKVVNS